MLLDTECLGGVTVSAVWGGSEDARSSGVQNSAVHDMDLCMWEGVGRRIMCKCGRDNVKMGTWRHMRCWLGILCE